MTVRAWRIVKAAFQESAFSGDGAAKYGGRWNSIGTPVVYTAESLSLATLEILVGGYPFASFCGYVRIPVEFDSSLVESLSPKKLPRHWNAYPADDGCHYIGDAWAKSMRSAVLKVPSAVIQEEYNYMMNPLHPDFSRIVTGKAEILSVDKRLLRQVR